LDNGNAQKISFSIEGLDNKAMAEAKNRLDNLVKPPGSLGELEMIAARLAGISGNMYYDMQKKCVIIMVSDNGVVAEGISAAPQSVTRAQTINFIRGITGVAAIAKQLKADLIVVDMGINGEIDHPMIKNKKIRKGTWNIAEQPAMSYDEAAQAVLSGIETAVQAVNDGYGIIGVGEMGIGNTTTSAAVLCALANLRPEQAAGRGAGLKDEAYRHKINVIKRALERNKPDSEDPLDVLAKVGGFDIAAMAGVFIGGAHKRVPVVIDGFISMTAALVAARINPAVKDYMFASHASMEPGYAHAAEILGMKPCLHLNMRLGEGSGCPIMFAIIDAACAAMRDMGTFEEADIGEEYLSNLPEASN